MFDSNDEICCWYGRHWFQHQLQSADIANNNNRSVAIRWSTIIERIFIVALSINVYIEYFSGSFCCCCCSMERFVMYGYVCMETIPDCVHKLKNTKDDCEVCDAISVFFSLCLWISIPFPYLSLTFSFFFCILFASQSMENTWFFCVFSACSLLCLYGPLPCRNDFMFALYARQSHRMIWKKR